MLFRSELLPAEVRLVHGPGCPVCVTAAADVEAAILLARGGGVTLATFGDIFRQWAGQGYGAWFLMRYVRGERFSLHLTDLNAAGSFYVLAGATALHGLLHGLASAGSNAWWLGAAVTSLAVVGISLLASLQLAERSSRIAAAALVLLGGGLALASL